MRVRLDDCMVGRPFDRAFIDALPPQVDPCGENGEFHSFAFDGPIFGEPVRFQVGAKIYRPLESVSTVSDSSAAVFGSASRQTRGFWYSDLLPT